MANLKIHKDVNQILHKTLLYINWSNLMQAVRVTQRNKAKIMKNPSQKPDPDLIAEMAEAHKEIQAILIVWGPIVAKNLEWAKTVD